MYIWYIAMKGTASVGIVERVWPCSMLILTLIFNPSWSSINKIRAMFIVLSFNNSTFYDSVTIHAMFNVSIWCMSLCKHMSRFSPRGTSLRHHVLWRFAVVAPRSRREKKRETMSSQVWILKCKGHSLATLFRCLFVSLFMPFDATLNSQWMCEDPMWWNENLYIEVSRENLGYGNETYPRSFGIFDFLCMH